MKSNATLPACPFGVRCPAFVASPMFLCLGLLAGGALAGPPDPLIQSPNTWIKRSPLKDAPISPGVGCATSLAYDPQARQAIRWGGHNQGGRGGAAVRQAVPSGSTRCGRQAVPVRCLRLPHSGGLRPGCGGRSIALRADHPLSASVAFLQGGFPEQKIQVHEALEGYTLSSAFAAFEEKERGSLEVGKLADLVVLSRDILAPAKSNYRADAGVVLTMVGGRIVFEALPSE